jgi:hypothetical protein
VSVLRPPAPPRPPTRWLPRDAVAGAILGAGLLLVALPVFFLGLVALIAVVWSGNDEAVRGELLLALALLGTLAAALLALPLAAVRFYQGPPPGERRTRLLILGALGAAVTLFTYGGLLGRLLG